MKYFVSSIPSCSHCARTILCRAAGFKQTRHTEDIHMIRHRLHKYMLKHAYVFNMLDLLLIPECSTAYHLQWTCGLLIAHARGNRVENTNTCGINNIKHITQKIGVHPVHGSTHVLVFRSLRGHAEGLFRLVISFEQYEVCSLSNPFLEDAQLASLRIHCYVCDVYFTSHICWCI